ncbi:hypothetical protein SISNIDRAFT_451729 [Sistotremastrum niveocremeum HHB9708]|uniref:Uncharacterized protein n=2 Tax=Sistotremastraceae TaxID=3402574 RepID=A0A164XJU5_9AGAM|nr:hypothetical protein SISNIDRAFT_451729 [Sistotremastrum niveocremeum HHB9708]KZT44616.1 hypothetical protein SISSUDRAFT_1039159 [Sistotremastrum suecicum HHB10207 ss-3]
MRSVRSLLWATGALLLFSGLSSLLYMRSDKLPRLLQGDCPQVLVESEFSHPLPGPNITTRYRDALKPDGRYITSFLSAGWTNDVMAIANTLYIAKLTRRIPILPPFTPSHVGVHAGLIAFSEVFDIDRLSHELRTPILEWHTIKNLTQEDSLPSDDRFYSSYYGGEPEELGCWALWPTQRASGAGPRPGWLPDALNLDISWTPVPFGHNISQWDIHWRTQAIAELGWPQGHAWGVSQAPGYIPQLASKMASMPAENQEAPPPDRIPWPNSLDHQLEPDTQLFCVDFLYYMASFKTGEWGEDHSPVWNTIGTYIHWSRSMTALATQYINIALGLPAEGSIPPYIGVHVRRNDFLLWCWEVPRDECLAPISAYARRVDEIRQSLKKKGFADTDKIPVLISSDEPHVTATTSSFVDNKPLPPGTSEAWWEGVKALGWHWVDHDAMGTESKHGIWYPSLLDACIQSLGVGFVGTDRSTMSLLAARRVQDWVDGPFAMVKWGRPDSDAHRRRAFVEDL